MRWRQLLFDDFVRESVFYDPFDNGHNLLFYGIRRLTYWKLVAEFAPDSGADMSECGFYQFAPVPDRLRNQMLGLSIPRACIRIRAMIL
jgi:hypothetical protein